MLVKRLYRAERPLGPGEIHCGTRTHSPPCKPSQSLAFYPPRKKPCEALSDLQLRHTLAPKDSDHCSETSRGGLTGDVRGQCCPVSVQRARSAVLQQARCVSGFYAFHMSTKMRENQHRTLNF